VLENITLAPVNVLKESKETAKKEALSLLKTLGLEGVEALYPYQLSGGQKQRLSIARAIVRRPAIYIFDDSFSALDAKTDVELRHALKKVTKDSTVLIVAQKISTIMDATKIVVLNEGKIEGIGTHQSLLETNQVYREIALSQLSEEELACK
jgi:ATP-binding cassette subfamily B protein